MAEFKACTSPKPNNKRVPQAANLRDAVDASELVFLLAVRDKIAAELDYGVPARDMAPLIRQLRELDKEIRQIEEAAGGGGGKADEYWHAEAV